MTYHRPCQQEQSIKNAHYNLKTKDLCVCVNLWSSLLKTHAGKSQECCHSVSGGLCLWHPEQNQHAFRLPHQPAFFCSSLLKSKPTWLHCEELRVEQKTTSVAWILSNIQPYTKHANKMFAHFQACVHLCLTYPLRNSITAMSGCWVFLSASVSPD